jgi:hypothetical protein
MRIRKTILMALSSAAVLCAAAAAHADVGVYVGYADGLRGGADFPSPFGAGETFKVGSTTYTISNMVANLSGTPDSGAIMLLNTGATDVSVTNLVVNDRANGGVYSIWTGFGAGQLGAGITLHAGTGAIFAENSGNNFDSSDFPNAAALGAAESGTTFDPTTNNCSTGPIAATTACKSVSPLLTFTLNGSDSVFDDTAHVLDTGGYDSACCNHIHTGGSGVPEFNTNESLNWRLIGTTGINKPGGGGVPEPATWAMMLLGFFGLGATLRSRKTATA